MRQQKITVLFADDHPLARNGLVNMLKEFDELLIVGEAQDPYEAKAKALSLRPDVVMTDYEFTNSAESGIDVIKGLKESLPSTHCIMVTAYAERRYILRAYRAGAKAYLYKGASAREYIQAIEAVHAGMTYFSSDLGLELARLEKMPKPTPGELRLIPYFCFDDKLKAKEIARLVTRLDNPEEEIDRRTVETYKGNIKRKFNLKGSLSRFCIEYCEDRDIEYKHLN
jgi:DNA-binding NarL/FixJ family response regulator